MPYIRSNEDYDRANGTWRSSEDLLRDLETDKHMPDSVRQEIESDLRERGVKPCREGGFRQT